MITRSSRFRNPKGGILMEKQKVLLSGCNETMGQLVCKAIKESNDLYVLNGFDKRSSTGDGFPVYSDINKIAERPNIVINCSDDVKITLEIAEYALYQCVPIVTTTTDWHNYELYEIIQGYANRIPIFHATNFSVGMNIVKNLSMDAAMQLPDFDFEVYEWHPCIEKDTPSETAHMLANAIHEALKNPKICGHEGKQKECKIVLSSKRVGDLSSMHTIYISSKKESIMLQYASQSGEVFAEGAVKAAQFLLTKKPGFYGMEDLLS